MWLGVGELATWAKEGEGVMENEDREVGDLKGMNVWAGGLQFILPLLRNHGKFLSRKVMWPDGHSLYNMFDFFDYVFFISQALGWVLGEKKRGSDMRLAPPLPRHTHPMPGACGHI